MNLVQLHQYLGELIEAGTDRKLTMLMPGNHPESAPYELTSAMLVNGRYYADPLPLASGAKLKSGAGILLYGLQFDLDQLKESHAPEWPLIDTPSPDHS